MNDYYQTLGVSRDVGQDTLKKVYHKLAFEFHPDRNPNNPQAAEKFRELADAYGVLSDENKRRQYDDFGSVSGRGFTYSDDSADRFTREDLKITQRSLESLIRSYNEGLGVVGFVGTCGAYGTLNSLATNNQNNQVLAAGILCLGTGAVIGYVIYRLKKSCKDTLKKTKEEIARLNI